MTSNRSTRDGGKVDHGALFDGADEAFKKIVTASKTYAEYGVGKSTVWVLDNLDMDVLAVDTDRHWIDRVRAEAISDKRLSATHVDLGPLRNWGRPFTYANHHRFQNYTDAIWQHDTKPDVVLIDGRFRVCCFLTCLKYGDEGTIIIFDDYVGRPWFHIVEEFLAPAGRYGRQCIFKIPDRKSIDARRVDEFIEKFRFVMD